MAEQAVDYDALANKVRTSKPQAAAGGTVDYEALAKKARGVQDAPAANHSDYTSNPDKEGLYKMKGEDGTAVQVPFSKVMDARGEGYAFESADEATRHHRDSDAVDKPGWRAKVESAIQNQTPDSRTAKDLGLPENATHDEIVKAQWAKPRLETRVGHAVNKFAGGVAKDVLHPVDTALNFAHQMQTADDAAIPLPTERSTKARAEMVDQGNETAKQLKEDPIGTVADLAGQAFALESLGRVGRLGREAVEVIPERARTAAQRVVGASKAKVAAEAAKTAETATAEYEKVKAQNQKATEDTLRKRGKIDDINKLQDEAHKRRVGEDEEDNAKRVAKSKEAFEKLKSDHAEKSKAIEQENAKKLEEAQKKAQDAKKTHIEAVRQVNEHNESVRLANARRSALESGLKKAGQRYGEEIKTLEKKVRGHANKKYDDLREAMDGQGLPASSPRLADAVMKAEQKITGTEEQPKVIKELLKRYDSNELLPYSDLQGYYSEIGSKLAGGNLPGDIYQALKGLHEDLGGMMQDLAKHADAEARVADPSSKSNIAGQMQDARAYYRQFMQDFHEPAGPSGSGSPLAQSLRAEDPAKVISPFTGSAGDRGIQTVARHDSELAARINSVRTLHGESKAPSITVKTTPFGDETATVSKSTKEQPIPERKADKPLPEPKPLPAAPDPPPAPELRPERVPDAPHEYEEPEKYASREEPVLDTTQIRRELIQKTMTDWKTLKLSEVKRLAGSSVAGTLALLTRGNAAEGALLGAAGYVGFRGLQRIAAWAIEQPGVTEWLAKPPADEMAVLSKIPGIDKVRVQNGFTRIAVEAAKAGKPIALNPSVAKFIGPKNEKLVEVAEKAAKKSAGPTAEDEPDSEPLQEAERKPSFGRRNLADLHVDPKRFQYKLNADHEGVTDATAGAKWDQRLADPVHTWTDPEDGKEYVINGHHRYGMAKAAGAEGINVDQLSNEEFPTASSARAFGALKNIADGTGTSVDAAKFFRDEGITREDVEKRGLPLKKSVISEGLGLAKLSDDIFDQVIDGRVDAKTASAIGETTDVPEEQDAIMSAVRKSEKAGRPVSADVIREMARRARNAGSTTSTTMSLFGEESMTKNLMLETAEISDYIHKQLAQEKREFGSVANKGKADRLTRAGNTIDPAKNAELAKSAARQREVYEKLSSRTGPISDILKESAEELAQGGQSNAIKQHAFEKIRTILDKFFTQNE